MKINTYINEKCVLMIFYGNALIAEIENGKQDEKFIEDILFDMGYIWNNDGSISKIK